MASSKNYHHKARLIPLLSRYKKIIWAGMALVLVSIIIESVIWLGSAVNPHESVDLPNRISWSKQNQTNIFINPDWLIGVDRQTGQLKYTRLGEPVEPSQIVVMAKTNQIVLDGYILLDSDLDNIDAFSSELGARLSGEGVQSNLTHRQMITLWWLIRGDTVYQRQTAFSVAENRILEEKLAVAVLNGTAIAGLATEAAGWIEKLGATVVERGNSEEKVDTTRIVSYIDKDMSEATITRLNGIFGVVTVYDVKEQRQKYDIEIIVGSDFAR